MEGERTYLQCNGGRWRLSCQRHLTVIESDKNVPFSFHLEEHKVSHLNMKNWLSRYWTNYNATKMKSHKPYSKMVANLWLFFFLHDNWPSKSPFKVKVLLNSADAIEVDVNQTNNMYSSVILNVVRALKITVKVLMVLITRYLRKPPLECSRKVLQEILWPSSSIRMQEFSLEVISLSSFLRYITIRKISIRLWKYFIMSQY